MSDENIKNFFVETILAYYRKYKRTLPWRETNDPYKIWISEIILQQTQVKQGLPYYLKFIETFPTIHHLANASENQVLHIWQGLGYYSRARNLHHAAKQIVTKFNGKFPESYEDILTLKGIGEYTASAIASFAYKLPYPVLDGNVYRVLSRYFGIDIPIDTSKGKKFFYELAKDVLDKKNPDEYNQAIMEFGATYCVPAHPDCYNCLLNRYCIAFHQNKVKNYPVKSRLKQKKNRYFNYFIFIENEKYIYIKKRQQSDIWKGLYEFHLEESHKQHLSLQEINTLLKAYKIKPKSVTVKEHQKHILTHQKLSIQFVIVKISERLLHLKLQRILQEKIKEYPFPIVIQKFIKNHFNL